MHPILCEWKAQHSEVKTVYSQGLQEAQQHED
jgi:hypothetical protein